MTVIPLIEAYFRPPTSPLEMKTVNRNALDLTGLEPRVKLAQVDPRRVRMTDRNRNALFDQLVERALDVSPFVR